MIFDNSHHDQTGYLPYMDELAKDLNALPDISKHLKNPADWPLAFKLIFGPPVAAQYFLDGEDKCEAAKRFLSNL